jgi:hypothetical protein
MDEELAEELEALSAIYGEEDLVIKPWVAQAGHSPRDSGGHHLFLTVVVRPQGRAVVVKITLQREYPTAPAEATAEWDAYEGGGEGAVTRSRDIEWLTGAVRRANAVAVTEIESPHIFAMLSELTAVLEEEMASPGIENAMARRKKQHPSIHMPRSRWVQLNRSRIGDGEDRPIKLDTFLTAAKREITVALHKSGFKVGRFHPVLQLSEFHRLCGDSL